MTRIGSNHGCHVTPATPVALFVRAPMIAATRVPCHELFVVEHPVNVCRSAVLIQSLAEQNAQVVQAVEVLRQRQQRLTVAVGVLAVGCAGLLVWVLRP